MTSYHPDDDLPRCITCGSIDDHRVWCPLWGEDDTDTLAADPVDAEDEDAEEWPSDEV